MTKLLTLGEVKIITNDIADSIIRHNKFYWWELPLILAVFGGIFLSFGGLAIFLTKVLLINNMFLFGIIVVSYLIISLYFMIDGYDIIKSKIIIKIKYGKLENNRWEEMLEKYKLKPGDEGYLDEAGRRRYLIYASICTALLLIVGYFFFKSI